MRNQLEFHQLSSVGDRVVNQDCMANKVCNEYALFVVADGLGGHHAGEKASEFFCNGMFRQAAKFHKLIENSPQNAGDILTAWVSAAVADMAALFSGDAEAVNAHTTCAILYLNDNLVLTAHCGDSRLYRINQNQVLWRTKDHSLIQKKLEEGIITESEMGLHPEQNQLTRSINIQTNDQPEVRVFPPMRKGETFILCTDGFWEFIKEKDLLQLAAANAGKDDLIKVAKLMHFRAQGKSDNLTVQWVRCC